MFKFNDKEIRNDILIFLLLNLKKLNTFSSVFIVNFEKLNPFWD